MNECLVGSPRLEPLENRLLLNADLSLEIGSVKVAGKNATEVRLVPGDTLLVELLLTNVGDQPARGLSAFELFASADAVLDGADESLIAPTNRFVNVLPGATVRQIFTVRVPADAEPGDFYLLARVAPGVAVGDANAANDTAASDAPARVRWVSGAVDGRSVILRVSDDDGTILMLRTVGGTAELTPDPAPDLAVTGTTATSSLFGTITARGADGVFRIGNVTFDSAVGTVSLGPATITGNVNAPGGARNVTLGDLTDPAHQVVTLGLSPLIASSMLRAGRLRNVQVDSASPLSMVRLTEWLDDDATADRLTAPSVGSLMVSGWLPAALAGDFQADLVLGRPGPAQPLRMASISGQLAQGLWDIGGKGGTIMAGSVAADWRANFAGTLTGLTVRGPMAGKLSAASISTVSILGDMPGGQVLAGADLGRDAALGGVGEDADAFAPAGINSFMVRGVATDVLVAAGLHPGDGQIGDLNDLYLGGPASSIRVASFGDLTAGSQVAAGQLPRRVTVAKQSLDPAVDPRFGQNRYAMVDTGTTDANGEVVLDIASQPQTFCLVDEQTQVPLEGFLAAIAVDAQAQSLGMVTFVDPSGRRPARFVVLRGSSAPALAPLAGRPESAQASLQSAPAVQAEDPDVITVYGSNITTEVLTDAVTDKLLDATIQQVPGQTQEQLDAIKEGVGFAASGMVSLLGMGLQLIDTMSNGSLSRAFAQSKYAKTELLTPEQALAKISADRSEDTTTSLLMLSMGNIIEDLANPYAAAGMALDLMGDTVARQAIGVGVGLPNMGIRVTSLFGFEFYSVSPLTIAEQLAQSGLVSVTVPNGADLTNGSLELIRTGELGTAMRIPLDAAGNATATVPQGQYRALFRAPGYRTDSLDLVVPPEGVSVNHAMEFPPIPGITVNPLDLETDEKGTMEGEFTVVLDTAPTAAVTVRLAGDASEGRLSKSVLYFTPANWSTPQTVTVIGVQDRIADGDILYDITLTATSTDVDYAGMAATVSVVNYDTTMVGSYSGYFSGYTTDSASFPPAVFRDTVTGWLSIDIDGGSGTDLSPYTGTMTLDGTFTITPIVNPGGNYYGDVIPKYDSAPLDAFDASISSTIYDFSDTGYIAEFTNGHFVGTNLVGTMTIDLLLDGVAPIVGTVTLTPV